MLIWKPHQIERRFALHCYLFLLFGVVIGVEHGLAVFVSVFGQFILVMLMALFWSLNHTAINLVQMPRLSMI